jgi:hypothetical protein
MTPKQAKAVTAAEPAALAASIPALTAMQARRVSSGATKTLVRILSLTGRTAHNVASADPQQLPNLLRGLI